MGAVDDPFDQRPGFNKVLGRVGVIGAWVGF